MTVETQSAFLSSLSCSETTRPALRLMTPPEPNRPPAYGRLVQEADHRPQESPRFGGLGFSQASNSNSPLTKSGFVDSV